MGNGMLFNRDLKTPTESEDKATLLTDKSFANVEIKNEKLFCISRLKKYPDDYSVIPSKGINEIEIDNLKGFELFAKNNDKENEEMYQVILFDQNGVYYLFIGTYVTGSENAISPQFSLKQHEMFQQNFHSVFLQILFFSKTYEHFISVNVDG